MALRKQLVDSHYTTSVVLRYEDAGVRLAVGKDPPVATGNGSSDAGDMTEAYLGSSFCFRQPIQPKERTAQ